MSLRHKAVWFVLVVSIGLVMGGCTLLPLSDSNLDRVIDLEKINSMHHAEATDPIITPEEIEAIGCNPTATEKQIRRCVTRSVIKAGCAIPGASVAEIRQCMYEVFAP